MPYANPEDQLARARYRYREQQGNKEAKLAQSRQWRKDNPKRIAWLDQKHTSKQRGVKFILTFEEFVAFWGDDFVLRGRRRDQLQMCRYGDAGDYELGNIYKATQEENDAGPRHKEDL